MHRTGIIDVHAVCEAIMSTRAKLRLLGRGGLPAITDGVESARADELETLRAIHDRVGEIAALLQNR
jgi:hypothetical protein